MKVKIQRYLFTIILFSLGFVSHGEAHNLFLNGYWEVKDCPAFEFFTEEETESESDELHEFSDNIKIDKGSGGNDKSSDKLHQLLSKPASIFEINFNSFFRLINLQTNKVKALAFESNYLDTPCTSLFLLFQSLKLDTPA